MHSYREAIAIASTFDVLGINSPLIRKLKLDGESDWISFISNSGAVIAGGNCSSDGGGEGGGDAGEISIHLEKFLRHCYDIAYKLPATSSSQVARAHVRSSSLAALSAMSAAGGEN